MSKYIQFKAEQVEYAKRHLLCEYLQKCVDENEINLFEAIEEQMRINSIFATGRKEMENGNYQAVSPALFAEIEKRSQALNQA